MESTSPRLRLATVPQASQEFPQFSQAAFRDLIFKAAPRVNSRGQKIPGNGLAEKGAVVRVGRKVLIDLDRFEEWLDGHRVAA